MTLFLFKPHVVGPEGNITTPDIVIDRVFVDGKPKPLNLLTSEIAHQVEAGETTTPAYAVTALGGGALISPAILLASGRISLARKAWRLTNLDGHMDAVTLNGIRLMELGPPADAIAQVGGVDDALPRGYVVARSASVQGTTAELADNTLGRTLTHEVILESVDHDRWGDARPRPRYSVGPTQKDVTHYI